MSTRVGLLTLLLCSIGGAVSSAFGMGCGGPNGQSCTMDEECPSHFCKADGTCGPAPVDGSMDVDAAVDGTTQLCTPNHDGTITLGELPLIPGRMATFRIANDAAWDTAGTAGGGVRNWDLAVQLSNDADTNVALASPSGAWWAQNPTFSTATYTAPLSSTSDLIGVFHVDSAGVTLLGVVSPQGGTYRTELEYDPPAKILAVPFKDADTWSSSSTVSGYAQGAFVAYTEAYDSSVDKVGMMKTPYGEFPVLRVATDLARTSGVATLLTKRSYAWVAECFGSVATVQSQDFESASEFNDPAEVRRLAP